MIIKKILVIDWLDKYAGSERVVSSITKLFKFESCYTLVNKMSPEDIKKTFSNKPILIHQSFLKHLKFRFRMFFFLFPKAISSFTIIKDRGVVISSSHSVAKGFRTNNSQLHISYFQARNQKYLWDDVDLYFGYFSKFLKPLINYLRTIDVKMSKRPNYIIANSIFVQNWILETYNLESTVIYPPVDLKSFSYQILKEDYFIAVGRLEKYKRFDLLVEAFNKIGKKLIIIGDGSEFKKLKVKSSKNIKFLGYQTTEIVNEYLGKAKAFIHIGTEDFGIAPLEAQACGTPVIAYNNGGIKETVLHLKTGFLFNKQTVDCIVDSIIKFETLSFNTEEIRKNAERFGKDRFEKELKEFVDLKIKEFYN